MKILLTGAAGFLGSACRRVLRERGHSLVTTDRHGEVDVVGDLAEPGFAALLPEVDAVVHAAAVQYVSPDLPLLARARYFEHNNVLATRRLCERYGLGATHFVNVATSMMYRQCHAASYGPGSALQGQGVYSRSKLAAQRDVEVSLGHWASIVPCIIGGPGREGLFRGFVQSILRRGLVAFPGRGSAPTNMVHVDDVAELVAVVVERRAEGLYNAGAPRPLSITQWVGEIAAELGVAQVRILRVPLAPVRALAWLTGYRLLAREQLLMLGQPHVLDISRSLELGWAPRHDHVRIVRDIARYIAASQGACAGASASGSAAERSH